jgi:flagellar hook protein FlgE
MPFQVAISGIKAAADDLNVIGNNIANANTAGFKRSRTEFADVYAVTHLGVASETPGSGVTVSRVAQQFDSVHVSFTKNDLDLAIDGEGFFILDDNGSRAYTRAGAFGLDRDGYVVNAAGQKLVTFQVDASGKVTGATGPLKISTADGTPQATSEMTVGVNLDSRETAPTTAFDPTDSSSYNWSTPANTIYDSLGGSHSVTTYYRKTADNTWDAYTSVDGNAVSGPDTLTFSSSGALATPASGLVTTGSFTPSGGAAAMTLTLDYSQATQFGSSFGVNKISQDGFAAGRLTGLDIDKNGTISTRFSNGRTLVQGQVALANFANPQGLQPLGNTAWAETHASGDVAITGPGTAGVGFIQSGALEDSNVDISEELVKLIIAQRNYQANAEVISTADQVTQSIINIR